MTGDAESEIPPAEKVNDIPRILRALREAIVEALISHKMAGNPVAIWRDGRVDWIPPEDIPVPDRRTGKTYRG